MTRSPTLSDRIDLCVLQLAKRRRLRMSSTASPDREAFYEAFFEEKDLAFGTEDPRREILRESINRALTLPAGSVVLDVGCGLGDTLAGITGDHSLLGIDYAMSNVMATRRRLGSRAVVIRTSADRLPFSDASVDACLCIEVLEHLPDDAAAVREIARVLKPGGILVASVPSAYYWPQYLELIGHLRHYNRDGFRRLLEAAGLDVAEYLPTYPNWHRRYMAGYIRTRLLAETLGRLTGRRSPYEFRLPWSNQTEIERLRKKLEPLRAKDRALDYAAMPTSTFVRATRAAEAPHPRGGPR